MVLKNKIKFSKPSGKEKDSSRFGRRGTRVDRDYLTFDNNSIFEYSEEFLDALDRNDEQKLHEIFSKHDWRRHLEGYWLR